MSICLPSSVFFFFHINNRLINLFTRLLTIRRLLRPSVTLMDWPLCHFFFAFFICKWRLRVMSESTANASTYIVSVITSFAPRNDVLIVVLIVFWWERSFLRRDLTNNRNHSNWITSHYRLSIASENNQSPELCWWQASLSCFFFLTLTPTPTSHLFLRLTLPSSIRRFQ